MAFTATHSDAMTSILRQVEDHAISSWTETVTADNAVATATHVGEVDKQHYITSVAGSFNAAAIALMTLSDGGAVIGNWHVHNQMELVFANPIQISAVANVSLELGASGTLGTIGAATLIGYTV